MFSDLECDYINPIDLCSKLNHFVLPDMILHGLITLLLLLFGNWIDFFVNLPIAAWNVHKYRILTRILGQKYRFDATEIFRTIGAQKRESFVKLGFYLVCFFLFLYRMIESLVSQ
jgi:protein cornichon